MTTTFPKRSRSTLCPPELITISRKVHAEGRSSPLFIFFCSPWYVVADVIVEVIDAFKQHLRVKHVIG